MDTRLNQALFPNSFINNQVALIHEIGRPLHPDAEAKDARLLVEEKRINPIIEYMRNLAVTEEKPYIISSIAAKQSYTGLIKKINRNIHDLDQGYAWPKQHMLTPTLEQIKVNIINYVNRTYPGAEQPDGPINKKFLTSSNRIMRSLTRANDRLQRKQTCIDLKETTKTYAPPTLGWGTVGALIGLFICGAIDGMTIGIKKAVIENDNYCDFIKQSVPDGCALVYRDDISSNDYNLVDAGCNYFYSCNETIDTTGIRESVRSGASSYSKAAGDDWLHGDEPKTMTKDALITGGTVGFFFGALFGLFKAANEERPTGRNEPLLPLSKHPSDIEKGSLRKS